MDTLIPLAPKVPAFASALPPENPLPMPRQSLRARPVVFRKPKTAPAFIRLRRIFVFGASATLTAIGGWQMYEVLQVGGLTPLEGLVLALFIVLFAWIALSFVNSVVGFVVLLFGRSSTLGIDRNDPVPQLTSRTALLLPTYNEDPHRVMARLQAVYESVAEVGQLSQFDFFVLSDSTNPSIWLAEEDAFLRLRAELASDQLFYRHRVKNTERKAGNIGDWVSRFGGAYQAMIVLDADSLMEGATIVRLAAALERHPDVGLIQTLPQLLNARTLFARLQQFAGAVYGPIIASGLAWWNGAEGNYWGHNAIIRVAAFASCAGLPVLTGPNVFGGHILSHDFVEAALMRRAGWAVHMAPELGGSYEESPPTLTDHAVRDRRWCQGNLQHAGVLPARGLHWVSRLHLLIGIGTYVTAPLWLAFLLVGILISLQAEFIRPEYFPRGATLFPQWPAEDPVRAAYVFAGTMAMLLIPKFLGWAAAIAFKRSRNGIGGVFRGSVSFVIEIVVSALIAPIMMFKQCRAVFEILLGRDAGWSAQRRDDNDTLLSEAVRHYGITTLVGLGFAVVASAVSIPLLLWMLPVVAGVLLAIPIAALTGSRRVGERLKGMGLLLIPEERMVPKLLLRANALAERTPAETSADGYNALKDREFCAWHLETLGDSPPRRKGDIDVHLAVALAKIDEATDCDEALALLSSEELFAVLANRAALEHLLARRGKYSIDQLSAVVRQAIPPTQCGS